MLGLADGDRLWGDFIAWLQGRFAGIETRAVTVRDTSHARSTALAADGGRPTGDRGRRRPAEPPRQGALGRLLAFGRNTWRQLTSMRTALILLFLLALASLPGALLPQWSLNTAKTAQYIVDHPTLGPLLDRLGFFEVFGSPWYAAIYLLLFISLVGCLLPRTLEFVGQLRMDPVATPRNLGRLPHHHRPRFPARRTRSPTGSPPVCAGWRIARRTEAGEAGGRPRSPSPPRRATSGRSATWSSTSRCSGCWWRSRSASWSATRAR